MSDEKKLEITLQLSHFTKQLFIEGLRERFPEKSENDIKKLYLERLQLCYNRNY